MKKLWGLTVSLGITGIPLSLLTASEFVPELSGACSNAGSELSLSDQGSDDNTEEQSVVESVLSSSSEDLTRSLQSSEKVRRLEQRQEHQSYEVKRQGQLLIQLSEQLKEIKQQEQLGRQQQITGQTQLLQEVRKQLKAERQELERRQAQGKEQQEEQARLARQQRLEQQRLLEEQAQLLNAMQRRLEQQQEDADSSLVCRIRALPNILRAWLAEHTLITGSTTAALVAAVAYYWYKKFCSGKQEAKMCVDCESEWAAL